MKLSDLTKKYLDWCKSHRAHNSYVFYENYIRQFLEYPGIADMAAMSVKPYHVQEWIDSHGDKWGDNYRGGAVICMKRVYHWAEEMGYVKSNPIKKLKKPANVRRKIYMKPDDYAKILEVLDKDDPFRMLLVFAWVSGCRPQEGRHIEKRHFFPEKRRIVFPAEESKGKKRERIIRLNDDALDILSPLADKHPEGTLFRNVDGDPWTRHSICSRMQRISKRIGKRLTFYSTRHGFATRKLIQKVDPITLANILGHSDGSMLAKVYSHVEDDDEHMRAALQD